jgi:hypothetical protein
MDEESGILRASYLCFQITVENSEWVLKNSTTGRSFDLGDFPVGYRAFFFYLRSEPWLIRKRSDLTVFVKPD